MMWLASPRLDTSRSQSSSFGNKTNNSMDRNIHLTQTRQLRYNSGIRNQTVEAKHCEKARGNTAIWAGVEGTTNLCSLVWPCP